MSRCNLTNFLDEGKHKFQAPSAFRLLKWKTDEGLDLWKWQSAITHKKHPLRRASQLVGRRLSLPLREFRIAFPMWEPTLPYRYLCHVDTVARPMVAPLPSYIRGKGPRISADIRGICPGSVPMPRDTGRYPWHRHNYCIVLWSMMPAVVHKALVPCSSPFFRVINLQAII